MAEATKPVNFTDTPEFKDAVGKAAAEAAAKAVAEALVQIRADAGTASDASDPGWVKSLAMQLSALTNQGTGSKMRAPLSPDVVKYRQDSRERMFNLLIEARGKGGVPSYRVNTKMLLDNVLVEPFWIDAAHTAQPTEIDWPGVPNEGMVPLNECAAGIYAAFEGSIGVMQSDDAAAVLASRKQFEQPRQGLVIKTSPGAQRRVTGNEAPDDLSLLQGLRVKHDNQPGRYKEVNILGNIAAPARQSI